MSEQKSRMEGFGFSWRLFHSSRSGRQGSALIWMLLVVLVIMSAVLGVADFGRKTGDSVRRQVTADACAESLGNVLEERLRHIGRLQKQGMEALETEETEAAQAAADAAWQIARGTPAALREEARAVAAANGASRWEVRGLPLSAEEWFAPEPMEDSEMEWVSLTRPFRDQRMSVVIWQPSADGDDLRAQAPVPPPSNRPEGPIVGAASDEN